MKRSLRPSRLSSDEGLTLVEMMVALLVLGVILSGLAAVIMNVARASVISEHEVRATALAQQAVEELMTIEWDNAALYEDHIADVVSDHGADGEDWRDRLDGSGDYNGRGLVTVPAPGAESARRSQVPTPVEEYERSGTDYVVHRYVTRVNRSESEGEDSLRFNVHVTWDGSGSEREIMVAGERLPTQSEAAASDSGVAVLQFNASPNPSYLDGVTPEQDIQVAVRLNAGVTSGELRYPVLIVDPDSDPDDAFEDRHIWDIHTRTMTPSDASPSGVGYLTWTTTIPANAHVFVNGTADLQFVALDGPDAVESYRSLTFIEGDHSGTYPRPPSETGDDDDPDLVFPAPPNGGEDEDEDENGDEEADPPDSDVEILSTNADSQVCVSAGDWIAQEFVVRVNVKGLEEATGDVTVSYQYRTKASPGSGHLDTSNDAAHYESGSESSSTWKTVIGGGETRRFQPGESVTFTIDVRRGGDAQNASTEITRPVQAC